MLNSPRTRRTARTALALGVALAALVAGCKKTVTATPTGAPASAATATPTTSAPTTPPPTATGSASLCDLIIEINTNAGSMTDKTFAPSFTGAQIKQIVDQVILRQDELAAAATAAGRAGSWPVVMEFYKAMSSAGAGDPSFYDDYAAGKRDAIQKLAGLMPDFQAFAAQQRSLAAYEKQVCGIKFP